MYKIFISYSTKDIDDVNNVEYYLNELGNEINIFRADRSVAPGEYISDEISMAINNCDLFVLFWSKNAKNSEWVPLEIGKAHSLKKNILPLLLTQNLDLPPFLSGMKYIPLYKNFASGINQLKKSVNKKLLVNDLTNNAIMIGGTVAALSGAAFLGLKKFLNNKKNAKKINPEIAIETEREN